MKKIYTLLLTLLLSGLTQTFAQLGNGWDSAFNFGGAGNSVSEMRYDANGNLYFLASVMGKNLFAGTQIDPGGFGSFPSNETIYGKIAPDGTQTLLKRIKSAGEGRLDADGNLYMILRAGYPSAPIDFGNGIINNTFGAKILKISNNGIAQWIKPIVTGTAEQYGAAGIAILNVQGMQITPDGNLYVVTAANGLALNPPNTQYTNPHRIIKFNASGDEVWHTELFTSSSLAGIAVPKIFVDDAGQVTFGLYDRSNLWYYNGEALASQMGVYQNTAYSLVISLNADGSKKNTIADLGTNATTTFSGLNPINGDVYISYSAYSAKASTQAPFSTLPNIYAGTFFENSLYVFNGMLVYNSAGQYLKYILSKDAPVLTTITRSGNNFVSSLSKTLNEVYTKGNYNFTSTTDYGVLEFLDQNFNFIKALQVPKINIATIYQNKVSISGEFKTPLTFGSKTLTPSFNDTDFGTRFPFFASIKADMFIAVADNGTTLPITLASFNANKANTGIKLTWQTASEKNSAYFEVQKSSDGVSFTTIGKVDAAGNSSENKYYSLTDFIPAKGINYYRLNQVDIDGAAVLSKPISINFDLGADNKIAIYPNPAVNEVHFTGLKTGATVSLFNLEGKMVLSQSISNNTLQIPASVKSGMYLMSVKANDGSTTTLKVSVSK